jgi:hypothetical protein
VIIKTLFFKITVLLKSKLISAMTEKSAGFSNILKKRFKKDNLKKLKIPEMIQRTRFFKIKTGQLTRTAFKVYSI